MYRYEKNKVSKEPDKATDATCPCGGTEWHRVASILARCEACGMVYSYHGRDLQYDVDNDNDSEKILMTEEEWEQCGLILIDAIKQTRF